MEEQTEPALQQPQCRPHARLRPRRPHHHAAGGGEIPGRDAATSTAPSTSFSSPAEEGIGGALAMLKDGLFERFPCDAIYALHNRPGMAGWEILHQCRPIGGRRRVLRRHRHRARRPRRPARAGHRSGAGRQATSSRRCSRSSRATCRRPKPRCSASPASMAGDAYNVIPQTATLAGTARAFSNADDDVAGTGAASRRAKAWPPRFGARPPVDFGVIFAPLINDAERDDRLRRRGRRRWWARRMWIAPSRRAWARRISAS